MAKVNQQDIIEAAIVLFNENGYHATSMQDIARALAIKKPSLYHHFESKEAILLTILETGMSRLIADLEQIVNSDHDCVTKLRLSILSHARIIADNPSGAGVFLREDRGLGSSYMDQYVHKRDHFESLLRTIINQGIDEGVLRPTDVPITAQAILGMVNWLTRWYRPEGRLSPDEIADSFIALVLNGLLVSQPHSVHGA